MNTTKRITALDGLRGVAILSVACYHIFFRWRSLVPWTPVYGSFPLFRFGYMGVQLFFLISGFVIYMTLDRSNRILGFLFRRWLRLFPAMLAASVLVYSSAGFFWERPAGIPKPRDLLPGLLFVEPRFLSGILKVDFQPLEGVFWSLFLEVKFYLLFGVFYFADRARAVYYLTGVACLGFGYKALAVAGLVRNPDGAESLRFFGWFCLGAFLYLAYTSNDLKSRRRYLLWAFVLIVPTAITSGPRERGDDLWEALAGLVVFSIFYLTLFTDLFQTFFGSDFFLFWGFISYPLYLIHENLLIAAIVKTHRVFPGMPALLTPLPGFCFAVLAAWLIARYIEPFLRRGLTFGRRSAS